MPVSYSPGDRAGPQEATGGQQAWKAREPCRGLPIAALGPLFPVAAKTTDSYL